MPAGQQAVEEACRTAMLAGLEVAAVAAGQQAVEEARRTAVLAG